MLRTKYLQEYDFDKKNPWSGLLTSVVLVIGSSHHILL